MATTAINATKRRREAGATPRAVARVVSRELGVPRFEQPDDVTCGPTCLMQVYRFYGDLRALEEIRDTLVRNADGGTLAVYLGISALSHGFGATLYPFDLEIFDPTWFKLDPDDLADKLAARGDTLRGKSRAAVFAYRDFLLLGGKIKFREPEPRLLVSIINRGHPVLCGLSATWLYKTPRECPDGSYDDVRGEPSGHFVVISGYDRQGERFRVRDPSGHVPFSADGAYVIPAGRLISAILLGDQTYDAVLLEIAPRRGKK